MDYRNNFLFSEAFIQDAFKKVEKNAKEYDDIFDNICSWYQEYKEDWTSFEDIALDTLGYEKEQDGDYRWIKIEADKTAALVYMLDRDCEVGSTVKGKYYAVDAVRKAAERTVSWVVITNGTECRLLTTTGVSPYEHFFSVNIGNELEAGKAGLSGHVFAFMFGANSFKKNGSDMLAIDAFKDKSDESEENVEEVLRSKSESILTGLCYGLKDNMNRPSFTEEDKKQIYEDAIILLYRLLFLGYAEARELLPVRADDPDYQDSFTMLCQTAKDYYIESRLTEVGNDFDLWDRLDSQLRIYVDKNYNGGLFSNDDKPILKEYRIANKHLAPCLMELAYIAGRKKDYAQKIEYKDLSVRNLGAIYEGLLEYQLFIADELMVQRKSKEKVAYIKASETTLKNSDKNNLVQPGEIYLSQDAMERKETGAYYTPEDVVDYIVKNTVGKRLDELKAELDDELKEVRDELSYEPVEHRRKQLQHEIDEKTVEFITEKILSLSIVDSAMGSGHFLVNAAYQVSNYIVDILEGNQWENDEINADVTYWRRRVVEKCIYGIDINNLSVALARLSLWLISMSNDKALSFLDHHLKCGNSLMGTTLEKLQYFDKNLPILSVTKERFIYPVIKKYDQIREIGSDTKADVRRQHEIYEEIREDLAVVKKKMDYYLACQYCGQILDGADFREVLLADNLDFFKRDEYQRLFESAEENKFFHWEVEFPEVYISGGFDIMIGNPPYGANLSEEIKSFFKTIYEIVHMRTPDTFNYFIAKSFDLLNDEGEVSFIVPSNLLFQNEYEKTRKFLVSKHGLRRVINAGDSVFARASVPTCVFIAKNTGSDSYEILYSDMRGGYKDSTEWNKGNITINSSSVLATPSCVIGVSEESSSILDKIKDNSLTIDELAEEVAAGISTGGNEAFCITEEDIKNESLESGLIYKMLGGRNIDAYSIRWSDEYIIYSTKNSNTPQYINTYKRLERFKEKLSKKRETKKGMLPWWSLHWPRNPDLFMGKKIIMRQTSDRIRATIDENNYYILNSILILKLKEGCEFSYEYVLGILNSALNNFVYRNLTQEKGRAFAEVKPKNIRKLYIPNMEQEYRDRIEMCVKRIMANENAEENKKTIDDMIYSFYSITEEEINVINKEVR